MNRQGRETRPLNTNVLSLKSSPNVCPHPFSLVDVTGESSIRGYEEKPSIQSASAETPLLPLNQGEYDEPIGLPLVVVCQNVDKMDLLEREMGYKEELFDFIQQFLRTILLKRNPRLNRV
jgi:hypothetical protein